MLLEVRKPAITPVPREINRLTDKGFRFIKKLHCYKINLLYSDIMSNIPDLAESNRQQSKL